MNLNTVNQLFSSGIYVTTTATRLPNIPLINNATIIAHSSNLAPVYIGNEYVTVNNGFPLAANAGVSLAIDNLNLVYGVVSTGSGDLRWLAN